MARASDMRCRMPCEYWPTGRVKLRIETHRADHLSHSGHRRRFRRGGRSSAGSPCRSSRRRAARDAPCSRFRGNFLRSFPEHADGALRRFSQSGQSAQQRGLPCSVVAEDGVKVSGVKFGGHSAQRSKASKLLDDFVTAMTDFAAGCFSHGEGGRKRVSHWYDRHLYRFRRFSEGSVGCRNQSARLGRGLCTWVMLFAGLAALHPVAPGC